MLKKNFVVNNICGFAFKLRKQHGDVLGRSRSGESDIQLTMREDRFSKVETDVIECLTLRFVDSHRESELNGKLTAL